MLASCSVQAEICQAESLYWFALIKAAGLISADFTFPPVLG
jgi:hypothetical protein